MESRPATLISPLGDRSSAGCPSDDDLLAYLPGDLSGSVADSIAAHLATCSACQSRITTLRQRLPGYVPARESASDSGLPGGALSDSPPTIANQLRPQAGQRLNEYELLEPIGRGGMGLVYRARHARLQRIVAVKVLPQTAVADDSAVIRMQRETAAAGRVEHPNIVYATDAGQCEGVHYLVMEYVQGLDLSKLVAVAGPLPVADACEIIRQAALGLEHIADCGLVHRDLKPSNLMLADDGSVKILDLGLALLHANPLDDYEATQPGYLLGTADYIAPEQIDAPHEVDVRSDLYSLGCTLYKLLTGSAPFSGPEQNSVHRKVEAHRHQPPPPVRTLRPSVPVEVERLLSQLLAKKPADRFQRPEQLARALAPLARGADLAGLARRLRESGELDVPPASLPPGTPAPTPRESHATTQTIARSETPRPSAASLRAIPTWAKFTAIAAILLAAVAFAASQFLRPDRYKEVQWIGHQPSRPPLFNAEKKMLELEPQFFQLIEFGKYNGQPGTFEVTIHPSQWRGGAGLFFGCRSEPKLGRAALTTFQLFVLEYSPPPLRENIRLTRQRTSILPAPTQLARDLEDVWCSRNQEFPSPPDKRVHLEITFGKGGCERVLANGEELKVLTTPEFNKMFQSQDYHGSYGLFCAPPGAPPGPTWFSDVVFTPAEK